MSGAKNASRVSTVKKDGSFRYATRFLALEKSRKNNSKETNSTKGCDCTHKTEGWKGSRHVQNSKLPVKKVNAKCCSAKDTKKKSTTTNHREKVVIVSKRSSSVSVVKSCNLRKSVSVKKVSYSTSVVLSSDEDIDSEEESEEEEKKEVSKKRKTILKHTTSKVKSSVHETKKSEDKNAQKAKALKLLCNKLSYDKHNERELRPRFPYNVLQEWPTARTHRMASLNALAKVHVLYENEGRTVGENLNDADESSLIDFLNDNSDDDDNDDTDTQKESKPAVSNTVKKNEKNDKNEKAKKADNEKMKKGKNKALLTKAKIPKRGKKRKLPEVEIIDTRICKRMASLNAQAILAASYLQEPKPKRIYKKMVKGGTDGKDVLLGSNCDVTIIKTEIIDDDELTEQSEPIKSFDKHSTETLENFTNKIEPLTKTPEILNKKWSMESEVAVVESSAVESVPANRSCSVENSIVSSTAATKVGVTKYTEVTKVHINTNKDTEIKEESKSERKIEHIISNDDVAITQMYHYQSKSTNESYCLQMQTTYKPASKSMSPSTSIAPNDRIHHYMNDPAVLPSNQSYYGHTSRDSIIPSQSYQLNPSMGAIPTVDDMDHRIPRQYGGSAFTVPHYRQPPRMQFSRNEYGYYQPAGPLIQPSNDQCTIHKPVPYHPQPNLHQPPQRPQQPSHHDGFPSFDSRHSQQNKLALSSRPHPIPPQQKPVTPSSPPVMEKLPSHSSSSQFSRSLPADDMKNRSLSSSSSSSTSFNRPSKHVRSPVMPTLYSSQHNFRTYQTQKRVPNSFRNYTQPSEKKDHISKHKDYESIPPHSSSSIKSTSHSMDKNDARPTEIHSSSHTGSHFKNLSNPMNSKERTWGFRNHGTSATAPNPNSSSANACNSGSSHLYSQDASSGMCIPPPRTASNVCIPGPSSTVYNPGSSHFMPYHDSRKGLHSTSTPEASRHPLRPPSVIEIVEDSPRDTKTYIQLEVPKNSHREKIVVVDVEDDEVEKKRTPVKVNEKILPAVVEKPPEKSTEKKCDNSSSTRKTTVTSAPQHEKIPVAHVVKEERLSTEQDNPKDPSQSNKTEGGPSNETPDVMFLEVKKKKESAVVRRARLHGKQRTFRDCYNRPLEQLLKTKKTDDVTIISEQHLPKNLQPLVLLPRFVLPKLEKAPLHGWSWEGSPNDRLVYISNDDPPCMRRCYPSVRHVEGDVISVRDCVFLRSGPRKTDLPFVAKVTALWGNPTNGEMTMSLLWYYRPEHTETIKKMHHSEDEIFASKHRDTNSVACIEDKCYVLTYSEYCRYRKKCKMTEENAAPSISIVPAGDDYTRQNRLPPLNVSPDLVLFCRKVYDYRQRRLLKNPL